MVLRAQVCSGHMSKRQYRVERAASGWIAISPAGGRAQCSSFEAAVRSCERHRLRVNLWWDDFTWRCGPDENPLVYVRTVTPPR